MQLSKNLEWIWTSKILNVIVKKQINSIQMMPMFKTLLHFSFEHFDLIFMVDKSTDHGKL